MDISERIKQYRSENKLTQSEFAEMVHVSKQAVSKWETDRGYPDISLYPLLSKIMDVSIDELMGKDDEVRRKHKPAFNLILSVIITITALLTITFFIGGNSETDNRKRVEAILNMDMPSVEKYETKDFSEWLPYNTVYPNTMYYYHFKDSSDLKQFNDQMSRRSEWQDTVSSEIQDFLPDSILFYTTTCDYYQLINLDNKERNSLPEEKGIYRFMFLCYQVDNKRLIIFEFEKEVTNEP